MSIKFKDTCRYTEKFSRYILDPLAGIITSDPSSQKEAVHLFDKPEEMVCAYMTIGYLTENGLPADDAVLSFINCYGMPRQDIALLSVSAFCEEAQGLYLHFTENAAPPYPENPEWLLETEPISALIKTGKNGAVTEWQTPDLTAAIELAYTLLLCGNERRLGLCKHCKTPFIVKNPKTEFCSPACRNKYNVYKSRSKS